MRKSTTTATKDARAWEELAGAGDRLADWGVSLARALIIIRDVLRRFELPATTEMEAVSIFLTGLEIAIGAALAALEDEVTAVAMDTATNISVA